MINRDWTTFEGRAYGRARSEEVRVTLSERSVFYLNRAAFTALGEPAAVELRYDGIRRIIGMKPTDARLRNAFPVKQHCGGNYRKINASAFCHHFRLRVDGTNLFDRADLTSDGILELPMDSMINVGRGAR
ncbi:MAG: hypothetical protein IPM50_11290 [Acidobacteriota bacterium]|nr:MAG: hypothetical protein IPM50_11290 [Acidobacteriota bacterium]